MNRGRRTLVTAVALVLTTSVSVAAQERSDLSLHVPAAVGERHPRLDARLLESPTGTDTDSTRPDDLVEVEIFVEPGAASGVSATVRSLGGSPQGDAGVVLASLPRSAVTGLAERAGVAWIRPASRPVPEVVAESVEFALADAWHDAGRTGVGVQIGVIDVGFAGWEAVANAGELPRSAQTLDLCDGGFEGDKHGTAVAEIVHDVAPDARLHLICIDSSVDLVPTVEYASEQGISIISHSVGWFNTGRGDGTGALQPAFEAAEAAGITWVNSAGNYALEHWRGTYDNTNGDIGGFHDFGPGDESLAFMLDQGESVSVNMRWDDWPGTSIDYDVWLYREESGGGLTFLTGSENPQTGTQPPLEDFSFTHLGADDTTFHLKFQQVSGPPHTPEIDLFVLGPWPGCTPPLEYHDPTHSINDAAAAPTVVAAGAASWTDGTIECFSSRGPNIDGLLKPDLTGPDRVSTASYGLGGFFGTSAAAPAVAGVGALLSESAPCAPASDLRAALATNTQDAGTAGPDVSYGVGLVRLTAPPATESFVRLQGLDRYETAVAVSQRSHPCGSHVVYVATGTTHPDALAAGPAAALEHAPILLTTPSSLSMATRDELLRLDPEEIVVLGGPAAVADDVLVEIVEAVPDATVERRWGADRHETAVAVTSAVFAAGVDTAYVTTGENYPDALGGAAAAVSTGSPLLLVRSDSVPRVTTEELERLAPKRIVILGGTAAVSSGVEAELGLLPGTVERVSGANRYDVSARLSAETWPGGARTVYVAVGTAFPDALAAGPLVASANGPLLLVTTDAVPASVESELARLGAVRVIVLGGPAAISESVAAAIEANFD